MLRFLQCIGSHCASTQPSVVFSLSVYVMRVRKLQTKEDITPTTSLAKCFGGHGVQLNLFYPRFLWFMVMTKPLTVTLSFTSFRVPPSHLISLWIQKENGLSVGLFTDFKVARTFEYCSSESHVCSAHYLNIITSRNENVILSITLTRKSIYGHIYLLHNQVSKFLLTVW